MIYLIKICNKRKLRPQFKQTTIFRSEGMPGRVMKLHNAIFNSLFDAIVENTVKFILTQYGTFHNNLNLLFST